MVAIDKMEHPSQKCIVLVQINNNHYMYLTLDDKRTAYSETMPLLSSLRLYLFTFLEDMSSSESEKDDDANVETDQIESSSYRWPLDGYKTHDSTEEQLTAQTFGLNGVEAFPDHESIEKSRRLALRFLD